jgi:signal transduction histidine kinase
MTAELFSTSTLSPMLEQLLHRLDEIFIPSAYTPDCEDYLTARMYLRVCWIAAITTIAYIPLNVFIGYYSGCVCLLVLAPAFCCIPFILKRTGNHTLVVNLIVLLAHSCFIFYIATDGGFPSAGTLFWLPTAPMVSLLLSQRFWATVWLCISVLTFVGFYVCWLLVGALPIHYNPQYKPIYSLIVMIGGLVVNFIIMALMETVRRKTYKAVRQQKVILEQQTHEIQKGNEQLQQKNIQLESLLQQNNDFLGMVVHDLKNPLAGIEATAKILEDSRLSLEEHQEFLQLIRYSSAQMLDLIKNLLEYNALEQKAILVHPAVCDVVVVVNTVLNSYRIAANKKGIALLFDAPPSLFVCLDTALTLQILDNLISNAIKFSPQGAPISVRVSLRGQQTMESHSYIEQAACRCVFEVSDKGPGLTEDDKKKMFGKFVKLSARPTGGEHSTGLGLSIVKTLVLLLDGSIHCESELGEGTTFIVELPTIHTDSMLPTLSAVHSTLHSAAYSSVENILQPV